MKVQLLLVFLVIGTALLLFYTMVRVEAGRNDIDQLSLLYHPIGSFVRPGSTISFETNLDRIRAVEYYYKTEFVLAPAVVMDTVGSDTILYLIDANLPKKDHLGYRTIGSGQVGQLSYLLITATK